jgi:hypothetical protein
MLVLFVARADDGYLVAEVDDLGYGFQEKVCTLVLGELGDDAQEGLVARGIESELFLELFAVDWLLREALRTVVLEYITVFFRVPFFVVDAVQYAD